MTDHLRQHEEPSGEWENLSEEQRNLILELASKIKEIYESDANSYPNHKTYPILIIEMVTEDKFGEKTAIARSIAGIKINELLEEEAKIYKTGRNIEM